MRILTLLFLLASFGFSQAQDFVQVSVGASYSKQAYYRFSDDNVNQVANESWDLAFTTYGLTDVGISLNESTTSVTGAPAPEAELYLTSANDFSAVIDTSDFTERLFNDESSWENGALNSVANPSNPFDFGWGDYNVANHTITGTRIFAIKLRNGQHKKFVVESYINGVYTLKYANLDGSDEKTARIDKSNFADAPLALFSFETGQTLSSAGQWDLVFCRYTTPLDDGSGGILQYPVTGVLSGPEVEVAEAAGVDPFNVDYHDYLDSFRTELDVIGYDWKYFDFSSGWVISFDVVYFVKTADNHLYQVQFIDFEGSSTGVTTFEKTDLGILTSVSNPESNFKEAAVFPNPTFGDATTLAFTLKESREDLYLKTTDATGNVVSMKKIEGREGLNTLTLHRGNLSSGLYFLQVGNSPAKDMITLRVIYQ